MLDGQSLKKTDGLLQHLKRPNALEHGFCGAMLRNDDSFTAAVDCVDKGLCMRLQLRN